ncbi:MAG: ethanolamine ammonia-lyase subunit EutC [Azoarcus sp.]|nr:ethanolamine ammonia-lyase subunit EutC [Azoarcus sp.]
MDEASPPDRWQALRALTPARIALGRSGNALPTAEVLRFGLAHARARDAVHLPLDVGALVTDLAAAGFSALQVHSAADDRVRYLLRPDLGRRLSDASGQALEEHAGPGADLCFVIADGLSAVAVQKHAVALLRAFDAVAHGQWTRTPVVIAEQGRVAIGDEIGQRLRARLVAVLIGERPGLSAPDSLGLYLTHAPRVGRSDAERNCISNIRPDGLPYTAAARSLAWLVQEALRRGETGVALKDEGDVPLIGGDAR